MSFFGWGVQLTQISGGGDVGGFDPGPLMYDWSAPIGLFAASFRVRPEAAQEQPRHAVDVLELPALATSTAETGFCLAADAQPAAGLSWSAPFARRRRIATWLEGSGTRAAQLYVTGTADPGGAGPALLRAERRLDARLRRGAGRVDAGVLARPEGLPLCRRRAAGAR